MKQLILIDYYYNFYFDYQIWEVSYEHSDYLLRKNTSLFVFTMSIVKLFSLEDALQKIACSNYHNINYVLMNNYFFV